VRAIHLDQHALKWRVEHASIVARNWSNDLAIIVTVSTPLRSRRPNRG
jgi:hypothetical protein